MRNTRNAVFGVVLVVAILVLLPGYVNAEVAVIQSGDDNTLMSAIPNGNGGGDSNLEIKNYGGQGHGLLRFDFSRFGSIPNTKITSIKLSLYMTRAGGGRQTLSIHEIKAANADWAAGTGGSRGTVQDGMSCWNYRSYDAAKPSKWAGAAGCSTAGIDYESTAISSLAVGSKSGWYEWTISAAGLGVIKAWADGTKANAGFLLRADRGRRNFRSFYNGGVNAKYCPKLTITYTIPKSAPIRVAGEADFFAALDLNRPGMENAKKAVAASDWPAAKKAMLDYMRSRKNPRFIVDRWRKDEFLKLSRSKLSKERAETLSKANRIIDPKSDWRKAHRVNGKIEWDRFKCGAVWAGGCMLNRMGDLNILGKARWLTDDRKYARYARELMESWMDSCPMPPVVRRSWHKRKPPSVMCVIGNAWGQSLDVAERMGHWVAFNEYFVDSPEITPEFYYRFLVSLLEHGRYIHTINSKGFSGGNWPIVECGGLSQVALMFPEFKESAAWWKQLKMLQSMQAKKIILPDGVQDERCIGYHEWCYEKFHATALLAKLNNVDLPAGFAEIVRKMGLYRERISYPGHNAWPSIGDNSSVTWWTGSKKMEKRTSAAPAYNSTELPYAGLFVMRSGWTSQDKFLLFDCVPPRSSGVHWHNSALNVDIYAYGRPLIVDVGGAGYAQPRHRSYERRVQAHNIIEIAGEENRADPKLKRWLRSPGFDLAEGTVSARWAAKMSRRVLFVKPDYWIIDDGAHVPHRYPTTANAYWHLNSRSVVVGGKQVELSAKGDGVVRRRWMGAEGKNLSFYTNDPGIGNILVIPDGSEKYVSLMLIADKPTGGHVACYRQDPHPPKKTHLRFTTLMYPFQGTSRPKVSFKDGVVKIGDDRVDSYFRKGKQTDGDCALVSRRSGKVQKVLLVGGSNVQGVVRADGKAKFIIVIRSGEAIDVQLIGAVKVKRLELPGFAGIKKVTVNGKLCVLSEDKGIP
ncbi:MAG: heparinase II/III family protein, partial [Phycisphaerae bacterium]|nr:heparinase II/III family protein [Phycisphaerae bacterium]